MNINPKVIDISHYDDIEYLSGQWIGFKKIYAAGYRGVINKATQGRGLIDKSYQRRRKPALDAGLLWGAYHYLTNEPAEEQAAHFIEVAKPDDKTLLAIDHETRGVSIDHLADMLRAVKNQTGRYPWLYSGFLIKEQMGNQIDPFWRNIKLWLAHYSANPTWPRTWDKPTLWQFTGDGIGPGPHTVPGVHIAGGCDINSYDGSDEQLKAVWAT